MHGSECASLHVHLKSCAYTDILSLTLKAELSANSTGPASKPLINFPILS